MSVRILVVENTIPYAEEACRMLETMGCYALSVPSSETLSIAERSDRAYDEVVYDAVVSTLQTQQFDIVIVNLHLDDDAKDPFSDGDFLGQRILDHVYVHYPGISLIVCTAYVPALTSSLYERYNVADVVHKRPPLNTTAVCDAVRRILENGHSVRRKIGRIYELKGINSQIYRFLHNAGILPKIFANVESFDDRLVKSLGADSHDERIIEATRLMADLWHLEPGLPCYPLVEKLGELEFGRAFWNGHRDHIVHHLLVYLLGLYLYYGSIHLRNALSVVMSEEDFLHTWKIAALFHDLGYVFEVQYNRKDGIDSEVFRELNDLRKRPLYHYFSARELPMLEAEDEKIRNTGEIFITEVNKDQIRSISILGSEDLFLFLEPCAARAHLGENDALKRYWEYAMSHETVDHTRNGYVDHGIAGSLVLLQQYLSLKRYVERALPVIKERHIVSKKTLDQISDLSKCVGKYQKFVELAASAISLHYISVDNWDLNDAFSSQELTLNQYCLDLAENPFAFFLSLVDVLQSWDRPHYAMPRGIGGVMQAQDVEIGFTKDGRIMIAYKTDKYRSTPGSLFAKTISSMLKYMNQHDVTSLLMEKTVV